MVSRRHSSPAPADPLSDPPKRGLGFRFIRRLYRVFFERPLWWFLAKVKEFFFADTLHRLGLIETRLTHIEDRLHRLETSGPAQWDVLEQLILAILRQPTQDCESSAISSDALHMAARSKPSEVNDMNATNSLR